MSNSTIPLETDTTRLCVAGPRSGPYPAPVAQTFEDRSLAGLSTSAVLAEAARAVHGAPDQGRLVSWVMEAATALTGADVAGLCLIARNRTPEWSTSVPPTPAERVGLAAIGDPRRHLTLLPAVRGDAPVRIDDLHGQRRGAGPLPRSLPQVSSLLAVPVVGADGIGRGVLVVGHPDPGRFTTKDEEALGALAAHVGIALENLERQATLEQLRATEQEIVNHLQAAVTPPRPVVPLTELATYYSPADPGAHTGGDLHDWILLPDGDLHLAVVDVMGKGVAATKDALAVTHALRLLVIDGCPLGQLVARADTIVTAQSPDLVATLLVGRYTPSTGVLRLAGGGHPPALLVSRGEVSQVFARGVPVGWPGAGSEEVVEVELDRVDTVILYTDGLIEGSKNIVEGLECLERFAAETVPYPAEQQARILVERTLRGAARRDDSLALILRRRVPARRQELPALGPFVHRLSRSRAAVSVSRGLLREWLIRVPVDDEHAEDLLLVASELCANAVEHATWENGGVVLRARAEGADVVIEVEDDGAGLNWPHLNAEPPDPEAEQGRGLWLVRTFTDEVAPAAVGGRTVVRALKRAVVAGP